MKTEEQAVTIIGEFFWQRPFADKLVAGDHLLPQSCPTIGTKKVFFRRPLISLIFFTSMLFLQTVRVTQDILHGYGRGLKLWLIQLAFCSHQLFVLSLQFRVADQRFIQLPLFGLRGLVVNKPDQIVLGKSFCHRLGLFGSFSFSSWSRHSASFPKQY